ncbi:MAG: four helix bundle protein [Patescibacteria group bacterium]
MRDKKENVILDKSYAFSLRIVKLYKFLVEKKKEYVMSKQVLKSGTSVGANVEEAVGAQTKKDFLTKINIAYKEARETHFWIRLLHDSQYITKEYAVSSLADCEEIERILGKIIATTKINLKNN